MSRRIVRLQKGARSTHLAARSPNSRGRGKTMRERAAKFNVTKVKPQDLRGGTHCRYSLASLAKVGDNTNVRKYTAVRTWR